MSWFWELNNTLNGIVWGPWMLCLLVGTGIWLTLALGVPQVRYFKLMLCEVLGNINRKSEDKGAISSFGAMATALSATVGTGNIAGVATALHLGGPGAVVWMLFSAIFGMTTKFCEIILSVKYRKKIEDNTKDDNYRGGTMYILEHALNMKWLAVIFAILTVLASFGIGAMVQANSTADGFAMAFGLKPVYTGFILAIFVGLVIWGGITRIAKVATYLVPSMAAFYIIGALFVIFSHASAIPNAIYMAFYGAFNDPTALPGGLAGWAVKVAITKGVARGVFSNEAGLGSAPMVHCTAKTDHPVRQGLYGLFEVFMDTIVICNLTALTILATGVLTSEPELSGAALSIAAFKSVLGPVGVTVLALSLAFFGLSTILGWFWYSETALLYLAKGNKALQTPYKIFYMLLVVLGAWGGNGALANLWDLSDTLNGMMAVPNLVALLLLTGVLRKEVKDFDAKLKSGELRR